MKTKLLIWLGIYNVGKRFTDMEKTLEAKERRIVDLERELRDCMRYIGALYDYLEVRPQRTFVQDYSRLPQEEFPTMEVIKVEKRKKKS